MKDRNEYLDIVRCVCNYMIVVLHTSSASQYCNIESVDYPYWHFINGYIAPAALPVLFLISGYLLFKNYNHTFDSYKSKITRRLKRLAVPYICWNVLFVVFYLSMSFFFPRLAARVDAFDLTSVSGALSKIISLTVHPIDGPLWFLRTLFIFSLVSPILWIFMKTKALRITGFVVLAITWIILTATGTYEWLEMKYPFYAMVTFYLGAVLAQYNHKPYEWFNNKIWIIVAIVVLILIYYLEYIYARELCIACANLLNLANCLFKMILMLGVMSCISTERLHRIATNPFTKYMIAISFFVYAGHFLVCSSVMHLEAPLLAGMFNYKYTVLALTFIFVGVAVLAAIYSLGKKICPKLLSLFDGSL